MIVNNPKKVIVIGFILILIGVIVPFLTVVKILEPNFLFLFLAYAASVAGLGLGIVGLVYLRDSDNRYDR